MSTFTVNQRKDLDTLFLITSFKNLKHFNDFIRLFCIIQNTLRYDLLSAYKYFLDNGTQVCKI